LSITSMTIAKITMTLKDRAYGLSVMGRETELVSVIVRTQLARLIDPVGMSIISLSASPTCVMVIGYVPALAVSGTMNLTVSMFPEGVGFVVGPIRAIAKTIVPFLVSILLIPMMGVFPSNPPASTLVKDIAEGSHLRWISPALIP